MAGFGLRMPTSELSTTTSNSSSTGTSERHIAEPSRTLLVMSPSR